MNMHTTTYNPQMQPNKRPPKYRAGAVLVIAVIVVLIGIWYSAKPAISDRMIANGITLTSSPVTGSLGAPDAKQSSQPARPIQQSDVNTPASRPVGTYQPGTRHELRLVEQSKKLLGTRKAYLLAYSADDAAWLDKFGYPTPVQEAQLNAMSLEDLTALAAQGDKNATTHVLARRIEGALKSGDLRAAQLAADSVEREFLYEHPYAASRLLIAYENTVRAYRNLPASEQTEDTKRIMKRYAEAYEYTAAFAELHDGNYKPRKVYDPQLMGGFLASENRSVTASEFNMNISALSEQRMSKGLPPVMVIPRPTPPFDAPGLYGREQDKDVQPVLYERY
jgi:hypothetical protein